MLCPWYGLIPRKLLLLCAPIAPRSLSVVGSGTLVSADGKTNLIVKAGTDWMTVHDHYVEIDARVCCESSTPGPGALNVDLAYRGRCELSKQTTAMFNFDDAAGKRSQDFYYYTTPYLSSRSPELSWVNETVFLASGTLFVNEDGTNSSLYRIYRVG